MLKVMRVVVFLAWVTCALAQDSSPEQLFRDAVEAQQRGDDALAVSKYRELVRLRPDVVEARANLGAALAHLGRFDEAIVEYEGALASDSSQVPIRMNLALAYYKAGRIERAAAAFEALHSTAPAEKRITLLLADCGLQQGDARRVIALLEPFDEEYRDDLAFSYLYGAALMQDNQTERGKQVLDRILRNGDSAEARVLMATARARVLDYTGAKRDLERALELNTTLPGVHSMYGVVLDGLMDPGSRGAYEKELEVNPGDFSANFHLGVTALHERRLEQAEALLTRALNVRPSDPGALLQLANLRSAEDKREDACRILEELTRSYPDFREAHVVLAGVYYRLKRQADGDREREMVKKLSAKRDAGVSPGSGAAAH